MTLTEIYANSDHLLLTATAEYEQLTFELVDFRERHTEAFLKYEKAYADTIEQLKAGEEKITIVKELAKRQCFEAYSEMLRAENHYKRVGYLRESKLERINTLKKIIDMKRT
jgi:hypothetical protein